MIESPCQSVCTYDSDKGHCLACGRTLAEITLWPEAGDADKRRILELARIRVARHPEST